MSIKIEAKRVRFGQSLTDFENQINSACSQLEQVKTNLLNMKSQIASDDDFTTEDSDEVQAVITNAVNRINKIIS